MIIHNFVTFNIVIYLAGVYGFCVIYNWVPLTIGLLLGEYITGNAINGIDIHLSE